MHDFRKIEALQRLLDLLGGCSQQRNYMFKVIPFFLSFFFVAKTPPCVIILSDSRVLSCAHLDAGIDTVYSLAFTHSHTVERG